ncbi:MAG: hypothetical protein KKF74_00975 [Nanoarchaeota archaeon]|nr:hypothetical protein [Nanoarchaeota archaeon]
MEKNHEKDIGRITENLYNIKIKPEYAKDDCIRKKLEEMGLKINIEIKSTQTYNVEIPFPKGIKESEKGNYLEIKLNELKPYVVYVEKSIEMKALDNYKTSYYGSNPV